MMKQKSKFKLLYSILDIYEFFFSFVISKKICSGKNYYDIKHVRIWDKIMAWL
jgi:hypothetical protein